MKIIYVYENWSEEKPNLIGKLYVDIIRGQEVFSFDYNLDWLNKNSLFLLDPDLKFYGGRQFPIDKKIFGVFADSSPDRWGRMLMKRKERMMADKENRKPNKLYESDFLLGVYDETRLGALRFSLEKDGQFLADDKTTAAPPWTTLRTLEEAAREFEKDEMGVSDKWLNQLIKPGSSLGGARPKATVQDENGELWIAKFPSKHDEVDSGLWEKITHDLAKLCGLNVPDSKIEKFSKYGTTFLVKRFDRDKSKRIHFSSAMTMLGKIDGASSTDGTSYLEIVEFIKSYGASPSKDLVELWKRIAFNMAVSNTDDHLRNHGFILTKNGWSLSPLYDVNPVPYGNELSLNVNEYDNKIDKELLLETAHYYGLNHIQAEEILYNMVEIIKNNWEKLGQKYGLSKNQLEYMKPAFDFCYN